VLEELRIRIAEVERLVAPSAPLAPLPAKNFTALLVDVRGTLAAIALDSVEEVVPYASLTPIPEAPRWAAGVLNLGGQAIYVIDVAARILGDEHRPSAQDFIVICHLLDRSIGLCVTGLQGVETFAPQAVAAASVDVVAARYMIGTISHQGVAVLFLSVEQLFRASAVPVNLEIIS
jgi:purine-binding chemotaxis protein CheW